MSVQPTGWQAPELEPGPAPGVAFASPGSRLVAYIVDVIIVGVFVCLLALLSVVLIVVLPILSILPIVAVIVVPFMYFPYYWARSGQTPGMRMMGIRVVRDRDGGPVTGGQAILRLHRLLDLRLRVLPRVHLDLHRQAQARLARPDRRHGRRGGGQVGSVIAPSRLTAAPVRARN